MRTYTQTARRRARQRGVLAYALDPEDRLTAEQHQAYDAAVVALEQGDWTAAGKLLAGVPDADQPAAFLRSVLSNAAAPPESWDGALSIERAGSVQFKTTASSGPTRIQ